MRIKGYFDMFGTELKVGDHIIYAVNRYGNDPHLRKARITGFKKDNWGEEIILLQAVKMEHVYDSQTDVWSYEEQPYKTWIMALTHKILVCNDKFTIDVGA